MAKRDTLALDESGQDLVQALKIAITLGAKINAIPGMKFYRVELHASDGEKYNIGCYATEKDAFQALARWVVNQWDETSSFSSTPWSDRDDDHHDYSEEELRRIFIEERTHKQIIKEYFDYEANTYDISIYLIEEPEKVE